MTRTWLWVALLSSSMTRANAAALDGGGRDVTVALFTTRVLRQVTITPLTPGAWTAACAACAHKPLTAPIIVSGGETYAGGTLRVADPADVEHAPIAAGLWHLRAYASGMDIVLTIPSERYTAAVVSAEADADEPQESLRALAIVARTYALNGRHYHAGPGHVPADLCDSTQCQAIRLGAVSTSVNDAVRATAGETLWFRASRAEVFFSQHCGGVTSDVSEAWAPGRAAQAVPYLRSHADPYCLRRGPAAWHASVSLDELMEVARLESWRLPTHIVQVSVAKRSVSGRAAHLLVRGAAGESAPLSASALRFGIDRALGWNRIRSDLYDVAVRNGSLVFDGRGHGHGVGLCQAGASEMATEHHAARAILAFYFTGTHVGITPDDAGWLESFVGTVKVQTTTVPSTETRDHVARAWQEAMQRFPVAKAPDPLVIFAPSTELYRQMTGQPGWNRASTRGNVVTLQPEQTLHAGHEGEESTLRHEFLHVLIESEATDRAPLWLREGLAETLSSDPSTPRTSKVTGADLDDLLTHASSMHEANAAHALAAARVHDLIARYGAITVRGWLKSGVPASALAGK